MLASAVYKPQHRKSSKSLSRSNSAGSRKERKVLNKTGKFSPGKFKKLKEEAKQSGSLKPAASSGKLKKFEKLKEILKTQQEAAKANKNSKPLIALNS